MKPSRRYDIDWLRVIAIGLLLVYHVAIGFQPWGPLILFITNETSLEAIWTPMTMINIWRIPLLFLVSGMGVYFAMAKRDWKQLIMERSKRILLPFIFGMLAIVPLHVLLWQDYYNQDITYVFNPGHLWFLGNIFLYVLLLSPMFFYLKQHEGGTIQRALSRLYNNPLTILLIALPYMAEAYLLQPEIFEIYAMNWHGFWLGLVAFLTGFTIVYAGQTFFKTAAKWRWAYLTMAIVMYALRYGYFELQEPGYLMAVESTLWIVSVLAFGYKYLNQPSKALSYLSEAVYPIYIVHMAYLYLASWIIFPLDLAVELKFVLVVLFTTVGCLATYELAIKRINLLRLLFGLKTGTTFNQKTSSNLVWASE